MKEAFRTFAGRVLRVFREALFPGKCLVCRAFLLNSPHYRAGAPLTNISIKKMWEEGGETLFQELMASCLCETCSSEFVPVESPRCPACGLMFKGKEQDDHLCGECLKSSGKIKKATAVCVYDASMARIVHALKYRGKTRLAVPLGQLLFLEYLKRYEEGEGEAPPGGEVVIPVPLHRKRFRKRGFNQAYLLIRRWETYAAELSDFEIDFTIDTKSLVRNRWTEPQAGLARKERMKNLKHAFSLTPAARIRGKRILLIDDVYTTGATARECAGVLLKGGAASVDIITFARTMKYSG